MSEPWIAYADRKPDKAGVYQWRVPSKRVPGLIVTFFAHMLERNAGYSRVLSPTFDHWDGYNLHVPKGTEWREAAEPPETKPHQSTGLCVDGVDNAPCPFCKAFPRWKAVEKSNNGGMFIGSDPHEFNTWWLECCAWAKTPHFDDPRKLAVARNALISPPPTGAPS